MKKDGSGGAAPQRCIQPAVRGAITLLVSVLVLTACADSYNYYNPLDPRENVPLEVVLPFVEDPVMRQAIQEAALEQNATTKFEIESVNVFDAQVTSLQGLEFFPDIRWLELNFVRLVQNNVDLTPLTKMQGLSFLNLMNNEFGPETMDRIPYFPQIAGLSLGFNPIGDAAVLVPLLTPYNRRQLNLDLQFAELEYDTLPAFAPVLDRLWRLELRSINSVSPLLDLGFLSSNGTITDLIIQDVDELVDASGLANLSGLRWLELIFLPNLSTGLEVLLDLPDLEEVDFFGSENVPLTVLNQLAARGVSVRYPDGSAASVFHGNP